MNYSTRYISSLHNDMNQSLNPVAVLHWLKNRKCLAPPYYLHIYPGGLEIGWKAKAQLICLNGEQTETHTWVDALKQLCDEAADDNNKAFGYLGFDAACDSTQGFSPDKSTCFPLLQFFIPEHRICIKNNAVEYRGTDCHLLEEMAQMSVSHLDFSLPRISPCSEFSEDAFMLAVARAKEYLSYDLSKVVLSRYMAFDYDGDLLPLFNEYSCRKNTQTRYLWISVKSAQ
jgi:anthranilate/para-aminobenzoate synthase component I